MSSASGVPTSSGALLPFLSRSRSQKCLERTAPLRRRMTRTSGLGVQSMIKNFALLIVPFAMLTFCPLGRAQGQEPTIDSTIAVVRANMQADRTALITSGMNFNEKDGAVFWPIYKQYEYERSKLDDRRVAVIKEYTQKYPTVTDAEAKAMAEQMLQCDSDLAALKKRY